MRWPLAIWLAIAMAGCGGSPLDADATAEAWVEAINAEDWSRACELSVKSNHDDCVSLIEKGFHDAAGQLRIANLRRDGDKTVFSVSAPDSGQFKGTKGWTAYAPIAFAVEAHGEQYLVHFEVAVIK